MAFPRGAQFDGRFAAEEKRKLFVVFTPVRAVVCSPMRERGAWNAQRKPRKLRKLLHRKFVSVAMPVGERQRVTLLFPITDSQSLQHKTKTAIRATSKCGSVGR